MSTFQVVAAQEMRRMPANPEKGWPEKAVDHLTLSGNGVQKLVTMFRKLDEPLPDVGSTIEVELGDPDRYDKDRRKATRPRLGGGGGGPRRRDPSETRAIQRQSARRDALTYIGLKVQLGKVKDFGMGDVGKVTDGMERLLDPPTPPSDVPGDTEGLPPTDDIPSENGDDIPF